MGGYWKFEGPSLGRPEVPSPRWEAASHEWGVPEGAAPNSARPRFRAEEMGVPAGF